MRLGRNSTSAMIVSSHSGQRNFGLGSFIDELPLNANNCPAKVYIRESLWKRRSGKDLWMDEVRQNLQAVNNSRPWTAEIIRAVGGINAIVSDGWQLINPIIFQKHLRLLNNLG